VTFKFSCFGTPTIITYKHPESRALIVSDNERILIFDFDFVFVFVFFFVVRDTAFEQVEMDILGEDKY
jgi:hypothetical protein